MTDQQKFLKPTFCFHIICLFHSFDKRLFRFRSNSSKNSFFAGDNSTDLRDNDDEINDPVDDRLTLAERNERLQNQLRSLKDELSHTTVESGETTMDRIHKENVKQGRDKYKTLREVRKGNTKRRVDQFENM